MFTGIKNIIKPRMFYALCILVIPTVIFGKQIVVSQNGNIKTISEALKIAKDGDEIVVENGVYKEANLVVDKKIKLTGNNFPVIDGDNQGGIITIKSNGIFVKGFVFSHAKMSFINDNAAIKLDSVNNCVIDGNKFIDNFFAIYLSQSSFCKILNNNIIAHNNRETTSGNGIHLWYCKNIEIANNRIDGQRDGIYFEFVVGAKIHGNYSKNNIRYGMHFMFSDSCNYWNNTFENNGAGVAVMYTKYVEMYDNNFKDNWGAASYGLLLKEIFDSKVYSNNFYKNTTGIYIEGCNRIVLSKNNFNSNGWAIKLMSNSIDNDFTKNNFMSNTFDVVTSSRNNFNMFEGNYWSDYKGYDLNKDGIGDVPFHPVKLSSLMVQQQPASMILLRSLFIELLDVAESVIPALTPQTLIDNKPMMRQVN